LEASAPVSGAVPEWAQWADSVVTAPVTAPMGAEYPNLEALLALAEVAPEPEESQLSEITGERSMVSLAKEATEQAMATTQNPDGSVIVLSPVDMPVPIGAHPLCRANLSFLS
jgi:hypothetical protein